MPHILLLEPDVMLADNLTKYFTKANFSVASYRDPQAAVHSIDLCLPHAVICELQLAGRSGLEFLYELRSYPEWQDIPVIVFTNLESDQAEQYQEILDELSVIAYLHKADTSLGDLLAYLNKVVAPAYESV